MTFMTSILILTIACTINADGIEVYHILFYCILPEYYDEGFLSLQHAINLAFIKEIDASSESEIDGMRIQMRRFPYPPYVDDNFILILQRQLPFLILLSFIVTAPNIVKDIIIEKENRLKVSNSYFYIICFSMDHVHK